MGRGRNRRRRLRRDQAQREKGVAISTLQSTSQAEHFVRGRLGSTSNGQTTGALIVNGAVSAPKTTHTVGAWTAPAKKQLEGRPNPVNTLRFSPNAWSKLQWFRDRGSTEIGGFGISMKEEPLYVHDFLTVGQQCTAAHVEFDDDAVAKLLDDMDRKGYTPDEVLRVWLHTHPGSSASPSGQDINTFHDVFGNSDWAIMVILAKGGECKARLRYTNGPGAELELTPQVDLHPPFAGVSGEDYVKWEEEYLANVRTRSFSSPTGHSVTHYPGRGARYPGYGAYDGNYSGWWNEDQNDETAGFHNAGSTNSGLPPKTASPASYNRAQSSSDISHPRTRLADQFEIPPYGGIHRLATRETAEKMRLINDCVEQVWQCDANDDDTKTVITDLAWYSFSPKAKINADIGDDIDSICDISDEAPIACGEVSWRVNGDGRLVPMKITRVLSSGQVIDLRSDEAVAAAELLQVTGASGGTVESTAGFAPASTATTDESVDVTEIKVEDDKETNTTPRGSQSLIPISRFCGICHLEIDLSNSYLVKDGCGTIKPGERAHVGCVLDKSGWLDVPRRSSKRETEIVTIEQVVAAATLKGNDEPGFGPATDGSSDARGDVTDSDGTGGDGDECCAIKGP